MDKLIISRLEEEISRDIIKVILDYYNVSEPLKQAYWRAYNAAHREGVKVA